MRRVLIVCACLLLAVSVAHAGKYEDAKHPVETFKPVIDEGRAYFESFEGTTFPPAGWTETVTNPGANYNWHRFVGTAAHGTAYARVLYDPALVPQDERVCFTYTIQPGDDCLTFYAAASPYWSITPYQNYNLYIYINGIERWNFRSAYAGGTTPFVWYQYILSLSGYSLGQMIEVCFRYAGADGATGQFDAIAIGECPVIPVCPFQYPSHIIDFNIDPNGWSSLACGTGPVPWQWGVPMGIPATACDGVAVTNVLATNLTGVYPVSKGEAAVIGPYALPSWCKTLELCHFYDYESSYDGGNVKISTDGGTTWTLIEPLGGYTTTLTSATYPAQCVAQQKVFSGTSTTFIRSCFDIHAYSGQTIWIGFFHGSESYSTTDLGWYIKWVKLGSDQEPSPVEDSSWGTIKAMYR
jgi:hypothetical protein